MKNSLVSILMPCFNAENYILEAIASVQQQTHSHWELILVDDCSTDNTVSIATSIAIQDNRIRIFKLPVNSGTGIARNTALTQAAGNYIAFLDADDVWKPHKLQVQLQFLKEHQLPCTFSFYECINAGGKPLNKRVEAPLQLTYRQLFFCNYIGNLTGIYDVSFYGKIPISHSRKRQDWMMWLTILKPIKMIRPVPESLAFYRVRNNSISAGKMALLQHNFAVYRTFHGHNWILSLFCMAVFLFTQILIKPWYIKKSN
ncbi:glycosyltransferase family 2 protein [Flavobacterium sp. ZT3P35]|uniref:glycosyltransferase family 2 protein n=1 Tax=Flavobacterium sp. ZT3P35 TaxID=3401727 RepID=UPI003AAE3340